MAKKYYLGLDDGTTGTTALLLDEDWNIVSRGYKEINQHFPHPGWVEHDPMEIWDSILTAVSDACSIAGIEPAQISCIGIDNQGETVMLWDKLTGKPVYNAIVWQDRRTAKYADSITDQYGNLVREKTGLMIDAYFSGTKIKWIMPDNGILGDLVTEESIRLLNVADGKVHFNDKITLDCDPMIGVIGVAPAVGAISCGTPDTHGGNMDNTRIRKGAILYLPVFHEGALLAMGDVHAVMGDGEIMVTGVEINAHITVRVTVLPEHAVSTPLLMDKDFCYVISSDENLEKAIYNATLTMNKIVRDRLSMSLNDAGMLMSAAGHLKICQVVDPKRTVTFAMPRKILPSLL